MDSQANVRQVVPFLMVTGMDRSVRYYVDGLGFAIKYQWVVDGKLRWCWLALGAAAVMLQEFHADAHPAGKLGEGMSLYFICDDAVAIYREFRSRGIDASEPQVGNSMWVTGLSDPDGYRLFFESPAEAPEDTRLSEVAG